MSRLYESQQEIEAVVRGFETCATPAGGFHHREHLTVAVWYLQTLSREQAVYAIRDALLRFLDHHGLDRKKYSEEVTVFWVDAVASCLEEIGAQASLVEKCNQVIGALNSLAHKPAVPVAASESLARF
jgi:hypothetical protein